MIRKRITRYVLVACVILCGPWLIAGCGDSTERPNDQEDQEEYCSVARLSGLIDEALALASVDVDTAYDEHLLRDPWTGERANCVSTAPDLIWREEPWIQTRELCVHRDCGVPPVTWNTTNFRTGFGTLKDGMMTFETLRVESVTQTSDGWAVIIGCGEDDGSDSLFIPLRAYGDRDVGCVGDGINVAVPGYVQIDYFVILVEVVDGVVDVTAADVNDLEIHVDPFGDPVLSGLTSDYVSGLAAWMEADIENFFGLMAKERVEAAYEEFVADCP
jgi:hypothetical protein